MHRACRLRILIAAALLTSSAQSAAFDLAYYGIFSRDSTTCGGDSNLVANCGASHPSNWCCLSGTNCLSLNNTGTNAVLCCPQGNTCTSIHPITCDVSFQDATKFPSASLHIENPNVSLPQCGSTLCCPLGFSCKDGGDVGLFCEMLDSTIASPSSTAFSSVVPTSTTSIHSTPTNNSTVTNLPSNSQSHKSKGGIVAAGIIPTLLVIAAVAVGIWWWMKRNDKKKRKISEPIYDPQRAARTDFLAIPSSSGTGPPSTSDSTSALAPSPPRPLQQRPLYPLSQPRPPMAQRPLPAPENMWSTSPPALANTAKRGTTAQRNTPLNRPQPRSLPPRPPVPPRETNSTYQLPSARYQTNK